MVIGGVGLFSKYAGSGLLRFFAALNLSGFFWPRRALFIRREPKVFGLNKRLQL
jgi:hypothetical protein